MPEFSLHIEDQTRRPTRGRVASVVPLVILFMAFACGSCFAGAPVWQSGPSGPSYHGESPKQSMIGARTGYLWGVNEIRLRDGDNANLAPQRRDLNLQSLVFGAQGETFAMSDLAVRAQAWLNVPAENRSDFYLDGTLRTWKTSAQYLGADLAAIYHLGLGGMPYAAGLVAGYRYNNFDYTSQPVENPYSTFDDHLHIHIPYLGVYYAHTHFVGSVVRLDVLASPFTLSRYDAEQHTGANVRSIDGHAITGAWFESHFQWARPVGKSALLGVFVTYNFLELSGGATVRSTAAGAAQATRFSLDSRLNLVLIGLSLTYAF